MGEIHLEPILDTELGSRSIEGASGTDYAIKDASSGTADDRTVFHEACLSRSLIWTAMTPLRSFDSAGA
jgi:hypothetical protein